MSHSTMTDDAFIKTSVAAIASALIHRWRRSPQDPAVAVFPRTEIFVSPGATSPMDGTRDRPFSSLDAALPNVLPGGFLELDEGTYPFRGVIAQRLTLASPAGAAIGLR